MRCIKAAKQKVSQTCTIMVHTLILATVLRTEKKKKLALHLCCHRSSLYGALVITFWPHFAANLQELLLANVSTSPGIAKRNHSFLKRTNQWKILQKPPHPKCRGRASHHSHQDLFLLYLPLLGCNKGSHNTIQDNHHNHQGFFNQE